MNQHKCSLLSPFSVACMYLFPRANHLVKQPVISMNWLIAYSPSRGRFPTQ